MSSFERFSSDDILELGMLYGLYGSFSAMLHLSGIYSRLGLPHCLRLGSIIEFSSGERIRPVDLLHFLGTVSLHNHVIKDQ